QRERGKSVILTGLKEESVQGDKAFLNMKEAIDKGDTTVDISDCPDLGPIIMAYLRKKRPSWMRGQLACKDEGVKPKILDFLLENVTFDYTGLPID
ncbi:MAG: hypothetical protein II503_03000, partial [Clostridia bacterium]|nr:hypothetical protein [Clostridia bacterium]